MPNKREKMIELAEVIDSYFGCDAAYFDVDKFTLAKRIMEAGWTKQEWISVKDRLPEYENQVLTYRGESGIIVERMFPGATWDFDYDIIDAVTHWMPLPQPPKGE